MGGFVREGGVADAALSGGRSELREDFVVLGEALRLVLVPEALAVDEHGELALAARLEGRVGAGLGLDRSRETRGLGFVVSDDAEADFDDHRGFSRGDVARGGSALGGALGAGCNWRRRSSRTKPTRA